MDTSYHVPVMLHETVDALNVGPGKIFVDATLGGGGHSEEILKRGGQLIAIDRDAEAIAFAQKRLVQTPAYEGRYTLVHDNFKNIKTVLESLSVEKIDGAVMDLGVSSHQLDEKSRGFSYMADAPLDMRMDRSQPLTAREVINEYPESELARILFTYGEERNARRIAREIVAARAKKPIGTTGELTKIIQSCFPPFVKGGHPAKRSYQAVRIETNRELDGLTTALNDFIEILRPGARLAVIAFHSLEDRAVKQNFRLLASDCICDKSLPVCVCNHHAVVRLPQSKGIRPSPQEQAGNPRSASATLRIAEKR